jgi:hypothetical protein
MQGNVVIRVHPDLCQLFSTDDVELMTILLEHGCDKEGVEDVRHQYYFDSVTTTVTYLFNQGKLHRLGESNSERQTKRGDGDVVMRR